MRAHRLVALAALVLAPVAHAMDFNLVGDTLVMSGPVVSDDLARLRDHLATERVRRVLLHESNGGDLWNGQQLAQRIRDRGLPTAVSGKCMSACGLIFLGGVERAFSDGAPLAHTMVGLHGAHHGETQQAMPEMGARMAHLIRGMTERKYPRDLLERTVYPKHPADVVFAFHPLRFPASQRPTGVMECLRQHDGTHRCAMLPGLDAIDIGVVTRADILPLDEEVKALLSKL